MPQEQFGEVEQVRDRNDQRASPASDEELAAANASLGNWPSIAAFDTTDDGTGSTLPANAVPDGVTVAVQAKNGNADLILVGPAGGSHVVELKAGSSTNYNVEDTSAIGFTAATAGDGVNVTFESN